MSNQNPELRIQRVECGICKQAFTDGTVPELATRIANHWNNEHSDELQISETPFDREVIVEGQIHGDEYRARVYEEYITAYDVVDDSGHSCGPFAYEYVKEPEAVDHCEDCWRSIDAVDGYQEIDATGWRTKYRCDRCERERTIQRRTEENQQITEWSA